MKEEQVFNPQFENAERIGYLIACFIKGTLTPLERSELDQWILTSDENELLFDELTADENIERTMKWYATINEQKAEQNLKQRISFKNEKRRKVSFPFVAVAASLIIIIGLALFFLSPKKQPPLVNPGELAQIQDVQPGTDKAVLTLANGQQILLDSAAPKTLSNGTIKINPGVLAYDPASATPPAENLLTVPRGAQFQVVLSDGTTVWLNAGSSLRYTTPFTGSERRVALTGEAYFEVAKNREKPFIVESAAGTIKVLGTHFNVNAYGDDNVFTTTLLEGSVQVSKNGVSKILNPGQQARTTEKNIEVVPANTDEAIAWKEGEFMFRNTAVPVIAKQLARWYNLDVEFRDPVEKHLNATIKRNVPLSKVLHYLEQTGDVHFKLEGRKLVIMN